MGLDGVGSLLQGIGSVLLAVVTALVGWRAAGALRIRIEGPLPLGSTLAVPDEAATPADEFRDAA